MYVVALIFLIYCYLFLLRSEGYKIPLPFYRSKPTAASSNSLASKRGSIVGENLKISHHSKYMTGSLYLRLGAISTFVPNVNELEIEIKVTKNYIQYFCARFSQKKHKLADINETRLNWQSF